MRIVLLKFKNSVYIEFFIFYILKNKLSNHIILVNNVKFFITVKNKVLFLKGNVILVEVTFFTLKSFLIYIESNSFNVKLLSNINFIL